MSYAVCRVQKMKVPSAITGLQMHNRRERAKSLSNPDIDFSRSVNNYALIEDRGQSFNFLIEERIKQGYTGSKAIRKDAVKLCEFIFTSDSHFFAQVANDLQKQKAFFTQCLNWVKARFGAKNIISAIVHMDEATPHMHLDFVPLTADGRLAAKDMLGGRKDLQRLQDDFWEKVGKPWGLERGERADFDNPNAPKPQRHLTTAEYKREVVKLEAKFDDLQKQAGILERNLEIARETKIETELDVEALTRKRAELQSQIRTLDNKEREIVSAIFELECNKRDLAQDFSNLRSTADKEQSRVNDLREQEQALERKIKGLESEFETGKAVIEKLNLEQETLSNKWLQLTEAIKRLKKPNCMTAKEIDSIGGKAIIGSKYTIDDEDMKKLKSQAKNCIGCLQKIAVLESELENLKNPPSERRLLGAKDIANFKAAVEAQRRAKLQEKEYDHDRDRDER